MDSNCDQWFLIKAKDKTCQGYMPAKNKEEACEKFPLSINQCIIKEVEWSGKEFIETDQSKQGKLL